MGRMLAWVGGVMAGLALILMIGFWLMPWTRLAQAGADRLSDQWGREVRVGQAQVQWGWPVRIVLTEISVANAGWAEEPLMAKMPRLEAGLRLPPLLTGTFSFAQLTVSEPRLLLQHGPDGQRNWDFLDRRGDGETAGPPRIDRLRIADGVVRYLDPARDVTMEAGFSAEDGMPAGQTGGGIRLDGAGTLAGAPLVVEGRGGPPLSLARGEAPFPVRLSVQAGDTAVRLSGAVATTDLRALSLDLALEGPDMAELFPLIGVPLPPTAAYAVSGRLIREGAVWQVTDLRGDVGDSDLAGWVRVEERQPRPLLHAELHSERLHLVDLGGLVGYDPHRPPDQQEGDGRVLPRLDISADRLGAIDMDVAFRGGEVQVPERLRDLGFRFRLQDRVAEVVDARLRAATGDFTGTLRLDARDSVPMAALDIAMNGLDFGSLFSGTGFRDQMSGRLDGLLRLEGPGSSLVEVMGHGTGRLTLILQDGTASRLMLAGLSGDVVDALGSLLGEDGPVPIRCGVGIGMIADGLLRSDVLFIDTETARARGDVTLNLKTEAIQAEIEADPKQGGPLSVPVVLAVTGNLSGASLALGNPEELALQGGAAALLGAVAGAVAGILPFLGGGQADDSPCGALVREAAQEKDGPALRRQRAEEAGEDG